MCISEGNNDGAAHRYSCHQGNHQSIGKGPIVGEALASNASMTGSLLKLCFPEMMFLGLLWVSVKNQTYRLGAANIAGFVENTVPAFGIQENSLTVHCSQPGICAQSKYTHPLYVLQK